MGKHKNNVKNALKRLYPVKRYKAEKTLQKYVYSILLPADKIEACNRNSDAKKTIIRGWESEHPEKAADLRQKIDQCIEKAGYPDSEADELDMKFWFYAYGYSPNEYINYGFRSKNYEERRQFISDRESVCLGHHLNDIFALRIFMDKAKTYEMFQRYYGRDCIAVEDDSDIDNFCRFIKKHPIFVKKDVGESCGRSVELIDATGRVPAELFSELRETPKLILEKRIEQSKALESLNPSSVNTVRCFTLRTKKGIEIPWTIMRTGRNGGFVDNAGVGGLFVGVNSETGIVETDGRDEYGFSYSKHPDTGVVFYGYQLPEWDKLIDTCREMAYLIPDVPWIGWDMAYTDQRWVVVEGNSMSEVIMPQSAYQRGIRNEFNRYINDVDLFIKNENVYTGKRFVKC